MQPHQAPRVDLKQVDVRLAVTDSPVGDTPWMIACPRGGDSTASFAVYPDHLHCFHCGFHVARRIESLSYLLGMDTHEAIKQAHKYTSAAVDGYRERVAQQVKHDPLPTALAHTYHKLLYGARRGRRKWLYDRGLREDTIRFALLGHDSTRFTIPFFSSNGDLVTVRYRLDPEYGTTDEHDKPLPKYSGMRGRNGLYLYPEWLIARDTRSYIVVCEGELDALRLIQEGIPACSPTNGAGNVKHTLKLLSKYDIIRELYIATDQDEPGCIAAKELSSLATQAGYNVHRLTWDRGWGKDITELYVGGHSLSDAGTTHALAPVFFGSFSSQ